MSRRANYESLRVIQWFFLAFPILFSLYVAGGILFSNTMRHDVMFFMTTFAEALGRPMGLCLLAFGIIHFYALPRLNRALRRYSAVVTGATGAPFARPQPLQQAVPVDLSIAVRTRLNWRWLVIFLPGIWITVALLWRGMFGARDAVADNVIGTLGLCLAIGVTLASNIRPRFNI